MRFVWLGLAVCLSFGIAGAADDPASFIASKLKFKQGLAFDIGCGDASLAVALARNTSLHFICVDSDENVVARARSALDAAGLYGVKASAEVSALEALPYPDNCAALVICGDQFAGGLRGRNLKEIYRILSPNGVALLGRAPSGPATLSAAALKGWLQEAQISTYELIEQAGLWARITKPFGPGWDEWTQRAHDAANTFASADTAVAGRAFVPRWFTRPIPGLSSASVAAANGRIIFSGMGYPAFPETTPFIQVLDAFTGMELWSKAGTKEWPVERPMGLYSSRENSQDMVVAGDTLYLLASKFCHVVNLESGAIEKSLPLPKEANPQVDDVWLYISLENGILYGAAGKSFSSQIDWHTMFHRGLSRAVFALDLKSHATLWARTTPVWTASIAVGGGQLYACDAEYTLHACDALSGAERWKAPAGLPAGSAVFGGTFYRERYFLAHNARWDAAPPKGSRARGSDPDSAFSITLTGGHNTRKLDAYSASSGKHQFTVDFGKRGVANVSFSGDTIFAGTQHVKDASAGLSAADAQTGKFKWSAGVSTKCTPTVASPNNVFMRAFTVTRVFDRTTLQPGVEGEAQIESVTFDGFRPTCAYPAVPAYGMLYIQAEGCFCSCALRGNLAMAPGTAGAAAKELPLLKGPAFSSAPAASDPQLWATWRADAGRSGRAPGKIPLPLKQAWATQLPGELTALAAGYGLLYCGSSSHKLHALESGSGKQKWQFIANGKINIAPFLDGGRVYFSDEAGWVWCLTAESGALVWAFRAAPARDTLLLNGAVASRWPSGGGVVVRDGVAYCTAGLFPAEKTYVYALDAANGTVRWQGNYSGTRGEHNPLGLAARGPLALSESQLYLTSGTGSPWRISLTGNQRNAQSLHGANLAAEIMPLDDKSSPCISTPAMDLVHHAIYKQGWALNCLPVRIEDTFYRANHLVEKSPHLAALKTAEAPERGAPRATAVWTAWANEPMTALIEAQGTLLSGGKGKVFATNRADGRELWSASVPGTVRDIAVYGGMLLVLTENSELRCFK